jgi:D-alanine--poly(phosphoribitol) ligase subunit 2
MSKKEKIVKIILEEVGILNEYLPESQQLELSPQTVLFGEEGSLDSLALVNLIVAVEERIEEDFDTTISLADERALSQTESPFRTISTLADYINSL